ncbi:MAG: flavodoxin family protein [Acidimicrobiia bacterium]|nr:flavodoxin family protein [Acidimicrobiia bacterium]
MKVAVLYESMTGNTRKAAELIGGAVARLGEEVEVMSVRNIDDLHFLSQADLVFLGTWVDGLIVAGHRPGGSKSIKAMPTLEGKPVAVFNTHAIHQGSMLDKLARLVERHGGEVVARAGFKRSNLSKGVKEFVADAVSAVPAPA